MAICQATQFIQPASPPNWDPTDLRKTILRILHKGKASHVGPCMSVLETLIAIYRSVDLEKIRTHAPDRSRVIVSKGHCAAAVYSVLAHAGLLDPERLETYHQDGSGLAGHINHAVDCVEHSTGALGHGLSVACGCALGLRSRGYPDRPVFAVMGDGEIQEGSIWEALLLIRHLRLTNLIAFIDNNRIGGVTRTETVIDMTPLRDRFAGFGYQVYDLDGHDVDTILDAIRRIQRNGEQGVIVCNTVKGRGVSFAENEPVWHYRPLNDETYAKAIAELEAHRR